MKVLWVCPTYGRFPHMLENVLAMLQYQTHPDLHLILLDDLGTIRPMSGDRWTLFSEQYRYPSLPHKFDRIAFDLAPKVYPDWEVLATLDDDDVYLPDHIANHVEALTLSGSHWSKPSKILSTYQRPPGQIQREPGHGRFPGSMAIRRHAYIKVGGWKGVMPNQAYRRADGDQQMISTMQKIGPPGDPTAHKKETYIYRWQDSGGGHSSGLMRAPDDETWYVNYRPDNTSDIDHLEPNFDPITLLLLKNPEVGYDPMESIAPICNPLST